MITVTSIFRIDPPSAFLPVIQPAPPQTPSSSPNSVFAHFPAAEFLPASLWFDKNKPQIQTSCGRPCASVGKHTYHVLNNVAGVNPTLILWHVLVSLHLSVAPRFPVSNVPVKHMSCMQKKKKNSYVDTGVLICLYLQSRVSCGSIIPSILQLCFCTLACLEAKTYD